MSCATRHFIQEEIVCVELIYQKQGPSRFFGASQVKITVIALEFFVNVQISLQTSFSPFLSEKRRGKAVILSFCRTYCKKYF